MPCTRKQCDICASTFLNVSHLSRHKRDVHSGIRHKCDLCDKTFASQYGLEIHHKQVHTQNHIIIKCDLCDKNFKEKSYLKHHIDSVHLRLKHNCDQCEKSYLDPKYLKEHKSQKHSKNPVKYECELAQNKLLKKLIETNSENKFLLMSGMSAGFYFV